MINNVSVNTGPILNGYGALGEMHSCEPHVHKFQAYLLHMQVWYSQPTGEAFADEGGIFEYLL